AENIFIFGLTAEEAEYERLNISRSPQLICDENPVVREVLASLRNGAFSRGNKELFRPLVESLMNPHDPYLLLRDFESYLECQGRVGEAFGDQEQWTRMAILNVARMGKFSTDRTIRQYAEEIWGIPVEKLS
ncbi:MAG: glycogen/starch/alpha-glucan phosphorylase, partial [Proteobacteria bacterium]|nr:glycogen/starch/alpha-glucan phosphorylase [Pseudomonadota bacterium]